MLRSLLLSLRRRIQRLEQGLQLLGQSRPVETIRTQRAADHEQSGVVGQQLKELPEASSLL